MKNSDMVIAGYAEMKIGFKIGRSAQDLAGEAAARALTGASVRRHTRLLGVQEGSA